MGLGFGKLQNSILEHLRSRGGRALSSAVLAKILFGEKVSVANKTNLRRALSSLKARGQIFRRDPLRGGGPARWKVWGQNDVTPPLTPKPPKEMLPHVFKYRPTGLPSRHDEYDDHVNQHPFAFTNGKDNRLRGGIRWDHPAQNQKVFIPD